MVFRGLALIALAALSLWAADTLPASAATRNIVLLFDERIELPGLSVLEHELVATLRTNSSEPIEIYREAMDLSRFESPSYKPLLRDFLRAKYAEKKIDVAVAIMAPAYDFLSAYSNDIFPGVALVFCGLDRTQLGTEELPPKTYGILIRREFAPTLEIALQLHPATNHIVIVSGTSEFDVKLLQQARNEFLPYEKRLKFTYLSDLPFDRLLQQLSQLPSGSIVLYTTMFQDGIGTPVVPHEAAERISAAAIVPTYGFLDQYLGRGIVGGSLYSVASHGIDTARVVLQVLSGVASTHLSEHSSSKMQFDWRQMLRWGISEGKLPPGAEIYFREASVWQTYGWHISIAVAALLGEAALIGGLLFEKRRRRYAEIESRQRMAELAHVNRFSMAGELTASIAHEINQPLGSILTNAEALQMMLASPTPDLDEIREIATDIQRDDLRASKVIERLRSLLKKTPFETKDVDLNQIIRESIDVLSGQAVSRNVDLRVLATPSPLPVKGDRIQLQQVLINLIANAMDSMSEVPPSERQVTISAARRGETAELSVADCGPGIPTDRLKEVFHPFFTTKAHGMGMGLSIARSIIEAHAGSISVENNDKKGAVFRVRLPLVPPAQISKTLATKALAKRVGQ